MTDKFKLPEGVELGSTTVVAGHGDYRSVYTISVENASPEVQKQFHALYEEQQAALKAKYAPTEDQCSISRRERGLSYSKSYCSACRLGPCRFDKFKGRY